MPTQLEDRARLERLYRTERRAHPHYPASTCIAIARAAIAHERQKRECWDDDEIPGAEGYRLRVECVPDDSSGAPWEQMDCHATPGWARLRGEHPPSGSVVLERDRGAALVYPRREAIERAARALRKHGYGHTESDIRAQAEREVSDEVDMLGRFARGDWQYVGVVVRVTAPDGSEIFHDSLFGVESDYWEHCVTDHDMVASAIERAREHYADACQVLGDARAESERARAERRRRGRGRTRRRRGTRAPGRVHVGHGMGPSERLGRVAHRVQGARVVPCAVRRCLHVPTQETGR